MAALGIVLYGDSVSDLAEAFGAIESLESVEQVVYCPTSDDQALVQTFHALCAHAKNPEAWSLMAFEPDTLSLIHI